MVWPSSWKIIKKVTKGYNLTFIKSLLSLGFRRLFFIGNVVISRREFVKRDYFTDGSCIGNEA